jgi:hypothetical protein
MTESYQNAASDAGSPIIEHWLAGGEILPAQLAVPSVWTPEKRLAAAVLRDALVVVRDAGGDAARRRVVAEDTRWIFSNDSTWPYAFVPLCHLFGIDPGWVRRMVRRWQQVPCSERARYGPRFRHAA